LPKQPGDAGARHSVILSLRVEQSLFLPPAQPRQRKNNLPAYTVGSLRANGQVECLVEGIDDLVSSDGSSPPSLSILPRITLSNH
jgi:hypothetical protein